MIKLTPFTQREANVFKQHYNNLKAVIMMLFFLPCNSITAQTEDSIKKNTSRLIRDKFPSTRFFDLQYEQLGNNAFDSKLYGNDYEKGSLTGQHRVRAAFNVPLIKKQKWTITSSLRYKFDSFDLVDVENTSGSSPVLQNRRNYEYHYFSGALSFTYISKLFNKAAIYNASIIGDGSDEGFERITGLVSASLVLKRTQSTTITAGLIAFVDKMAQFPILPTFTYEHHFANSKWSADLVLPSYFYMRRPLLENGRISLGSSIDTDSFYTYPNQPCFSTIYKYTRLEVKSGLMYEYNGGKDLTTTFRAGIANVFNGRLTQKGENQHSYIFNDNRTASGYFNIGISYNHF